MAKIMCTVGPASETPPVISSLITSGCRIFRLNFSHGDFPSHQRRLSVIRSVSRDLGVSVAVCGDLQGPKIRVGKVPAKEGGDKGAGGGGVMHLEEGEVCVLSASASESHERPDGKGGVEKVFSLTYKELVREVEVGHKVLINDGAIRMKAVGADASRGELRCEVLVGGPVTSGKGINLPESDIGAPAITDKDWECVDWAVENGLDYVALSFVKDEHEVKALKARLRLREAQKLGKETLTAEDGVKPIGVISKIEKPQAIPNLDGIIESSDGIMVARGDLGVEMEVESVPVVQKLIIERCQEFGKPCIVATQMLETMITSPIPTRAEASDVANAIFENADAVMLSAESATGRHPALVVSTMARIIRAAEGRMGGGKKVHAPPVRVTAANKMTATMALGAWHVVQDSDVKVVVCWSQHGNAARYLSQNDFSVPIVAFSEKERCVNQMALFNGVTPVKMTVPGHGYMSEFVDVVDAMLLESGMCKKGDFILVLGGRPLGKSKSTNTMQLHQVGHNDHHQARPLDAIL